MQNEDLIIREMTIADHGGVIDLMRIAPGITVREADSRDAVEVFLKRNPSLSFVAERTEQIVGCVMCGHDGRRGYLHHLVVSEAERGNGIGSSLVERCLQTRERIGIIKTHIHVFRENDHANAYWESKDWKRRDDIHVYSFNRSSNRNA